MGKKINDKIFHKCVVLALVHRMVAYVYRVYIEHDKITIYFVCDIDRERKYMLRSTQYKCLFQLNI